MIARRSVWSDPEVLELARAFVPVTDEVHRLQTGGDPECRLFQKIAEQGHYAGQTYPSSTRQGTYAAAPSGVLLASINSNDAKAMAGMLRRALERWDVLSREERLLPNDPAGETAQIRRAERFYPEDGLVLNVFSRDLPRGEATEEDDWTAHAWNRDMAWFTRDEARTFLPPEPTDAGQRHEVPEPIVRRLARLHFVDNVRGQTPAFRDDEVIAARLTAIVDALDDGEVRLRFEGESRAEAEGTWSVAGFSDMETPTPQRRAFGGRLLGYARYDRRRQRFTDFEMVALGTRWGATQYNVRRDDPGPAPLGFALTLAGNTPAERVAPAAFGGYGWR